MALYVPKRMESVLEQYDRNKERFKYFALLTICFSIGILLFYLLYETNRLKSDLTKLSKKSAKEFEHYSLPEELRQDESQIEEISIHIQKLVQNQTIPIGFIYVQLPFQEEPKVIWSWAEWSLISHLYAGHFFRVEGENAAPFGEKQLDAFQGHHHQLHYYYRYLTGPILGIKQYKMAEATTGADIGPFYDKIGKPIFDGSNGIPRTSNETRPINYAVRIWKRTA